MDCSPPGSSVSGILQARMLQWVSISSSRGSSRPRDRSPFCFTAGRSPASQADPLQRSLPGSPFFFRKASKRKKHSIPPSAHVLHPPRLFKLWHELHQSSSPTCSLTQLSVLLKDEPTSINTGPSVLSPLLMPFSLHPLRFNQLFAPHVNRRLNSSLHNPNAQIP